MPELYMLCGIPTSGKSTYTKTNFGMQLNTDFVVLSTDNYLEAIAEQNNSTYNEVFDAFIGQATKRLEFDLISATIAGKSIIWDQTNLSAKTRKKKLKKSQKLIAKLRFILRLNWNKHLNEMKLVKVNSFLKIFSKECIISLRFLLLKKDLILL